MLIWLGSIPLGTSNLVGPVSNDIERNATFAQHEPTRGKPVLQRIGEELDTQSFGFFFSEEFCEPSVELAKLELAYAMKSPLPLVLGNGVYLGKRYVVEHLGQSVKKTDRSGGIVRVESTIDLLEDPIAGGLFGLLTSIARGRATAVASRAGTNPQVRK